MSDFDASMEPLAATPIPLPPREGLGEGRALNEHDALVLEPIAK